jgi:pyrimidine-specific ribonucleoside hydrolase
VPGLLFLPLIFRLTHLRRVVLIACVIGAACSTRGAPPPPEATAAPPSPATRHVRVIVDTDGGPDDLAALAFLLSRHDVILEAVTTVEGLARPEAAAENVRRLLARAGRADVPVHAGRRPVARDARPFPGAWIELADTLPGVDLPASPPATPSAEEDAGSFLRRRLEDASRPLTLLALGPLGNVADVLSEGARLPALAGIVAMAGALRVPGNVARAGEAPRLAEWNVYADPAAADVVVRAGVPLLVVPLDATNDVPIDRAWIDTLRTRARDRLGVIAAQLLALGCAEGSCEGHFAWDPLAAVLLVEPAVARIEPVALTVITAGPEAGRLVVAGGEARRRARIATSADAAAFRQVFLEAFAAASDRMPPA